MPSRPAEQRKHGYQEDIQKKRESLISCENDQGNEHQRIARNVEREIRAGTPPELRCE
jgi:hypothetical protein